MSMTPHEQAMAPSQTCATITEVLRYWAARQPEKLLYRWLGDGGQEEALWTFATVDAKARAIAVSLQRVAQPGDRALLLYAPSIDYVAAFIGCLYAGSAWAVVGFCAVVSFGVDLGTPAVWAFLQDIGGRVTAAAAGWANMWGNFGASLTAMMVPWLLAVGANDEEGQRYVFLACAGALFMSALAALGLDASKPVWRNSEKGVGPAGAPRV